MFSPRQHTLAATVSTSGVGLHTGKRSKVSLSPAPPDSGIVFVRQGRRGAQTRIPARHEYATKLLRCSGLRSAEGLLVRTPEHLLAALYACEVGNVLVSLQGEELPILDGSARPWVDLVETAGVQEQEAQRRIVRVLEAVEVREGQRFVRLEPAAAPVVELALTLRNFGQLGYSGPLDPQSVRKEIVDARTFGPLRHVLPGKLWGLLSGSPIARGATLGRVVVHHNGRILNKGGLRMPDEIPRHRVLDVAGDLMLAGAPVLARVTAFRPAHRFNQDLVKKLMATRQAWVLETVAEAGAE